MRPVKHSKKLILFLALSALTLLVTCAEKIVNNGTQAISFQLAVSFENSQLAELVETYQVTIISASDTIVAELEMVDGVVEGTIENVPEGTGLLVVLEGLDAEGIVIYRGSAIIDVVAGQITEVEIELLPVVKLIRTSPKFLNTEFGTPFKSEIELYNLGGLTKITLTIDFDRTTLQLDSVSPGRGLPSGTNLSYSTDSSGKLVVNVSHSSAIVDSSGNTVLAQIYFRGTNSNLCQDSTVIDIIIDSLSAQATTIEEILVDRSKIIINRGLLSLSENSLQFGFGVPGLTLAFQGIEVTDSCGNSIPFTISTEHDWIDLNTRFGGLTADSIYIDVDTTGLATGTYTGSFIVQSPKAVNSPIEVIVTLQLDRGVRTLVVEPGVLTFSADESGQLPASRQFTISEFNSFNIPFSVRENISWLDLSDSTGTTEQVITTIITTTELAPGIYTDSIEIISPESNNSPQYVVVNYAIGSVPKFLQVVPDSIYFEFVQNSGDYPAEQLRIFESRGFSIPYSVIENIEWLLLSDTSGMTEDTITLYPNPNTPPGLYVDSIWIVSDSAEIGAISINVILQVIEADKFLIVSPDSLHFDYWIFGVEPIPTPLDTLFVTELNGYNTHFNVTEEIPWLRIWNVDSLTPGFVEIFIDRFNEPGNYIDSIFISSENAVNSPISVVISYNVIYRPLDFIFDPDTLYFTADQDGALPVSDRFQVFNVETGTTIVQFVVTESIPWLSVQPDNGRIGDFVNVNITSTALEPSIYFDSIRIEQPGTELIEPAYEYIKYTVVDRIPPSAVTDLAVDSITLSSAYLSWTASGDDSTVGTATETDLRYSTNLTTLLNWNGATQAAGEASPLISGSLEQFEVTNLIPGNMYYFGIEIIDNANNRSELSNIDSVNIRNLRPDSPLLISPDSSAVDVPVNVTFIWHSTERTDNYEITFDRANSDSVGYYFTDITDTVFSFESLEYATTYFWTVFAHNDGGSSGWTNVWTFTTESRPPTISGIVSDNNNNRISGAVVKVFDSYPTGNVLDSTLTDQNGAFEFFDIDGEVTLRTFKENHYPVVTELITPDTSLAITLLSLASYSTSDSWIDLHCESAMLHGHLVQPNDVIEAYDPDGNLCGRFVVSDAGAYGFMPVYRDDDITAEDEGCVYGDAVTIKVNQETARLEQPLVYPADYQNYEVCFDVTGEILSWIIFLEPAGGETFFIDSSALIKWSSNSTSDTLELYLTNPSISPILLENIADDGEHILTIPRTAYKSHDWSFILVDNFRFSPVSDTSNQFMIDAVELVLTPDTLKILGAADKCTPTTQDFKISESHNYLIPYFSSESISWLSINNIEGNTSSIVEVETNISGLPIGIYFDSIKIESADAVNSPAYVYVELVIREFLCGDFNDDCAIRIDDLTNLVDYLYRAGPPPLSADAMNVDRCGGLDIADVEFWYENFAFSNESNCDGSESCTSSENDMGAADSLKLIVSQLPLLVDSLYRLQLDLYLFNDANVVNGLAIGFDWDNSNLSLDSVIFSEQVENSLNLLRVAFENDDMHTSNTNQRFLFAGNRSLFPGLQASASQKLLASYYLSLTEWNASDSILIDTLTFNAGTTYKVISSDGAYQPVWLGPLVIRNGSSDK